MATKCIRRIDIRFSSMPKKWPHLYHKPKDSRQKLASKLRQLKKIESQILNELSELKEKEDEFSSPYRHCVGSLRVQFPYPIISTIVSPCYEYIAILFSLSKGEGLRGQIIALFKFNLTEFEYIASLSVQSQREDLTNYKQLFAVVRCNEVMLILSSVFSPASKEIEDNTISLWSLAEDSFSLMRKLTTENQTRCVLVSETHLIAAGEEGMVFLWNWSDLESIVNEVNPTILPQACYKEYHISCISKCLIYQQDDNAQLLFGLSTQGSLAIWNLETSKVLNVIHHCQFHLKDLHVLQCDKTQDAETISMLGLVSERQFSMNRFTPGKLAALKLQDNEITIGKPFPDHTIICVSAQSKLGLLSTDQGYIVLWNIEQGRELWSIKESNESSMLWLDWNEAKSSIVFTKANGVLVHLRLNR